MQRPAVFFDLGWTLCSVESGVWANYVVYPEAAPAIRLVNDKKWLAIVVSNQKSIAAGRGTLAEAEGRMDDIKKALLADDAVIDASYICPHADEDACSCRKPKTELYERAARDLRIDVRTSWVVGDLWRDVVAGHMVGARTAQVFTSHRAHTKAPDEFGAVVPDITAADVLEAVVAIMLRTDRDD